MTERVFRKDEYAQVVYTDDRPGALLYFFHIDPDSQEVVQVGAMSTSEDGYSDKLLEEGFEETDMDAFRDLHSS